MGHTVAIAATAGAGGVLRASSTSQPASPVSYSSYGYVIQRSIDDVV
jgi:hypothetical protein